VKTRVLLVDDDPAMRNMLVDQLTRRGFETSAASSVSGNKSAAARILGLDRRTMYRKLQRFTDQPGGPSDEDGPVPAQQP
jgi:two-component system response regulator HydG